MKRIICALLILITLVGGMIPVFADDGDTADTRWVNCPDGERLNVCASPNGKILYRLRCGTKVEIQTTVSAPDGWVYITEKHHSSGGFVRAGDLVSIRPGKYEITERDDHFVSVTPHYVAAHVPEEKNPKSACLYVSPNGTSAVIRTLGEGDILQMLASGRIWSIVFDFATGKTGYVANDYLSDQML